jgi:uncharacterized protein (DUF1800 family)
MIKTSMKVYYSFILLLLVSVLCPSFQKEKIAVAKLYFPYKKAGLTEREAAAHLLTRFTYGIKAGDIDHVVNLGLENWFLTQLDGGLNDDSLNVRLAQYEDLNLSNAEVDKKYPKNFQVLRMAIKDGAINKDSLHKADPKEQKQKIQAYMQKNGFKPQQELFRQFINQKILRAAYTNNQLNEMLTDFWFNHFNVSLTKPQSAAYIPAYERDVIRPHVTGKFHTLLLATAKSPAMLTFLDNSSSSGLPVASLNEGMETPTKPMKPKKAPSKMNRGLNENYAREVMELHTLGVDGGYTQNDVTQAARLLTGWTLTPTGDFRFAANRHDNEEKKVLGKIFPSNGAYHEGEELLSLLAHHPATALFISRKIATRFVNDNPPQALVEEMARTFVKSDGDLKQLMMTLVASPTFWSADALRNKTKSPFELAISTVRSLDATITQPYQLYNWINKMGQKMYYYQAPSGFPDRGQYWINTGALLNRMNFGLALAAQRIPGIKIDLLALNHHHEPESAHDALVTYSKIMLPERNLQNTIDRLKPMLNDPELAIKVQYATKPTNHKLLKPTALMPATADRTMLAQVVGVIIGSPEFQRK